MTSTRPRAGVAAPAGAAPTRRDESDQSDHDGDQRGHAPDAPPPDVRLTCRPGRAAAWCSRRSRSGPTIGDGQEEVGEGEHHGGRALGRGRGRRPSTPLRARSLSRIGCDRVGAGRSVGDLHPHARPRPRHLGRVERARQRAWRRRRVGPIRSLPDHEHRHPRSGPGKCGDRASRRWRRSPRNPACWSTASRSLAASPPGPGLPRRSASCFHASVRSVVLFLVVEPSASWSALTSSSSQRPLVLEPERAGDGGVGLLRGGDDGR